MSDTLSSAKAALHNASNFTKSVEGKDPGMYAKPAHEFSRAPYSMAHKERTGADKEISDVAQGLKWRAEQSKVANPQK